MKRRTNKTQAALHKTVRHAKKDMINKFIKALRAMKRMTAEQVIDISWVGLIKVELAMVKHSNICHRYMSHYVSRMLRRVCMLSNR